MGSLGGPGTTPGFGLIETVPNANPALTGSIYWAELDNNVNDVDDISVSNPIFWISKTPFQYDILNSSHNCLDKLKIR